MLDTSSKGLLEATKLTGAGRLMEATALIQRMLGGLPGAPPTARAQPGSRMPPTIDGVAERVDPRSDDTTRHVPQPPPGFLGKVNLRDLVRARPSAASVPVAVPDGAKFLSGTFANEAGSRSYKLYVPSTYRAGSAVPLIVMLHGCTQSPDDFAAGTGMNEVAEERNLLVVYPGQTASANAQKCWNWFNEGDQHRRAEEPLLIAGITRKIMADYAVDPKRVYVAGLSAGGAAAAIMGDAYPDLYAAIGVHSGLPCGAARDMLSAFTAMRQGSSMRSPASRVGSAIPAIVFHGDRDTTVSPRNGDAVAEQCASGLALRSRSEQGQVANGHAYGRITWTDSDGRVVVEQWTIHGATHAWAGGSPAGSYTDPRGPDASREMARFFMEHPKT